MNIVVRADANHKIGMGHIMRCLSIADAFASAGHYVSFILADNTVENLVKDRGYEISVMNSDYISMEEEKRPSTTPDIIIVDSYFVTAKYLTNLHDKVNTGGKLVYIDDVYAFPYPVDILVNYNAYSTPEKYDKLYTNASADKPQMILGPTYAPLRSMFRGIPHKKQNKVVKDVLISTGGSDELHLALSIIRFLLNHQNDGRRYHFLLGAMNTDKDEIKGMEGDGIVLHENVSDMKSFICSCDLAVSAAGSTLYEICACGVPLITYSLADNQIIGAEAFDRLGLGKNAGDLRDPDSTDHNAVMSGRLRSNAVELILTEAEKLADDYENRVSMGARMQELIDGFGAARMVQKIISFSQTSQAKS